MKNIILRSGIEQRDTIFYEYCSGEEFLQNLTMNISYDLLIVDMKMKMLDGNETAKRFREVFPMVTLVFCSGVYQPTVKSFEMTPFRYLLKKYTNERMQQEMEVIIKEVQSKKNEPYIVGIYHYNTVKLKPDEIMYIAIAKRGSTIYVCPNILKYEFEKNITCKEKVEELFLILKNCGFVYAHNSYIVNLKYIKRKTRTELQLIDGSVLSIARSKEKELRTALARNLAQKY